MSDLLFGATIAAGVVWGALRLLAFAFAPSRLTDYPCSRCNSGRKVTQAYPLGDDVALLCSQCADELDALIEQPPTAAQAAE